MGIYIGSAGIPKTVSEIYIGINGQPREVTEGYIGVSGLPVQFYSSEVIIENLPVGTLLRVPVATGYQSYLGAYINFKIADQNHAGYPTNSTTLITDKIIAVLGFDAKEPNNTDNDRQNYGNNRYRYSNISQWLNSNAAAGAWYTPQHSADHEPSSTYVTYNPYSGRAGLLAMIDANFVSLLLNTSIVTVKNTVTDGGGTESFISKMFLPSTTEVRLANEAGVEEGTLFPLFTTTNSSRYAYPTPECVSNSDYANASFNTSTVWHWRLRTPSSTTSQIPRHVNATGSLTQTNALVGFQGIRPVCNIQNTTLVDPTPNSDGSYNLII